MRWASPFLSPSFVLLIWILHLSNTFYKNNSVSAISFNYLEFLENQKDIDTTADDWRAIPKASKRKWVRTARTTVSWFHSTNLSSLCVRHSLYILMGGKPSVCKQKSQSSNPSQLDPKSKTTRQNTRQGTEKSGSSEEKQAFSNSYVEGKCSSGGVKFHNLSI